MVSANGVVDWKTCLIPVSYTHLDVYKRQVYGGTEHTNAYGGSTYGAYGAGAVHAYPGGATAYHCLLYTSRCV